MSARFANLRRQVKVAMVQLGHDPTRFQTDDDESLNILTSCKRCGAQAQIDAYGVITGSAIDAQQSCNAATSIQLSPLVEQAKTNEKLFKHLRQLH